MLLRQTATKGGIIVRIHRSDEWLRECFFFLDLFFTRYVEGQQEIEQNFFYDDTDEDIRKRHREFVGLTTRGDFIGEADHIPNRDIQRIRRDDPLFLDENTY